MVAQWMMSVTVSPLSYVSYLRSRRPSRPEDLYRCILVDAPSECNTMDQTCMGALSNTCLILICIQKIGTKIKRDIF